MPHEKPRSGNLSKPTRLVAAITGASGAAYGIRLAETLMKRPVELYLIISEAGRKVLAHETKYDGGSFEAFLKSRKVAFHEQAVLRHYDRNDLFAPPASGSFRHGGMIVAPCSMNTMGALASGVADDLIRRSADVTLKEKRPLILLIRETPLSLIHIENMRKLTLAGATIMPACPGFYSNPKTVSDVLDTVIARVLDHLKISQDLMTPWGETEKGN